MTFQTSDTPLRLGISACLLGQPVRYDGGHKRDGFLTDQLGPFVEWVPVCPEVEAGMGLPRPSMRLVRERDALRLLEKESGIDHSPRLSSFSRRRVRELRKLELSGYVLKKDSPSCGMTRVKVFGAKGMPRREGRGLFAEALLEALPDLPVEEEGRLNDPHLRENFIERIFAFARLRALFRDRWSPRKVVAFHTAHKLQLMAHSPSAYRSLGRRVAAVKEAPRAEFRKHYAAEFMAALRKLASRGRNVNVLQHAAGYFKRQLPSSARSELTDLIEEYGRGSVPLIVPITLVRHHASQLEVDYLKGQSFLEPHPRELMLRNHV